MNDRGAFSPAELAEIEEFKATHQGAAERIQMAVDRIEKVEGIKDAYESFNKLRKALTKNEISVFFSYKKKDQAAAEAIVGALREISAGKLQITYQADFPKDCLGKKWRVRIRQEIHHANWFILLFPDPSDDWDWCLFETGLFESRFTSGDSLICIHHPDTRIPNPIEGYQAVSATIPEVEGFLTDVCKKDNPLFGLDPINPYVTESRIQDCAKRIVNAIRPPKSCIVHNIYEPWISLKVSNLPEMCKKSDLDDALLLHANKEALDLFDFEQKPKTWGDLILSLSEVNGNAMNDRWQEELFHVIKKISDGRKFKPVQAVFLAKDSKLFRPVIYAVDRCRLDGAIVSYQITFSEEIGAVDASSIPKDLSVLASYLRFAFRFRWEILEKYTGRKLSEKDAERLENTIERIRTDANSRGLVGIDAILPLFDPEQTQRIKNIHHSWCLACNPERKGELDIAIKNNETDKIAEILKRFIAPSQEFLEIAANRFSVLVSKSPYDSYINQRAMEGTKPPLQMYYGNCN
jgi:hypothetical protein